MITMQQRAGNSFQQKLAGISLHYQMLQTLKASSHCACQFDGKTINNNTQTLPLLELTNICRNSGATPQVVASPNQDIGAGLEVKTIKTTSISSTGVTTPGFDSLGNPDPTKDTTEFQGDLIIEYKHSNLMHAVKPIKIPLLLSVDPQGTVIQCGANVDVSSILLTINRGIASLKSNEIADLVSDLTSIQGNVTTNRTAIDTNTPAIQEVKSKVNDSLTGILSHEDRIAVLEDSLQEPTCTVDDDCVGPGGTIGDSFWAGSQYCITRCDGSCCGWMRNLRRQMKKTCTARLPSSNTQTRGYWRSTIERIDESHLHINYHCVPIYCGN